MPPTKEQYERLKSCPDFTGKRKDTDAIIAFAEEHFDAKIYWSDKAYTYKKGFDKPIERQDPIYAQWGLVWTFGALQLDFTPKPVDTEEQKIDARRCAALLIYLWSHKVDVGIAIRCASCYVSGTSEMVTL